MFGYKRNGRVKSSPDGENVISRYTVRDFYAFKSYDELKEAYVEASAAGKGGKAIMTQVGKQYTTTLIRE